MITLTDQLRGELLRVYLVRAKIERKSRCCWKEGLFLLRLIFLGSRGLLQWQCGEYTEQELGQRKTIEKASTSVLKNHFLVSSCPKVLSLFHQQNEKRRRQKKKRNGKKENREGGREREKKKTKRKEKAAWNVIYSESPLALYSFVT